MSTKGILAVLFYAFIFICNLVLAVQGYGLNMFTTGFMVFMAFLIDWNKILSW